MKSLFNFFTSKGQLGALLLAVALIAVVFMTIFGGLGSAGYDSGTDLVPILQDEESTQTFDFFSPAVSIPVYLIGFAAILLVFFGIKSIVTDPKGSMKLIISLAVLAIIFFALYSMSEAETTGKISELVQEFDVSDNVSKMISGGIKTTLGLAVVSAVLMVIMEIWNLFK